MRITAGWLLLFATCTPGLAQNRQPAEGDPFSADRPGMAISTGVVPAGFIQFETGVQADIEHKSGERTVSTSFGSPVLRLGVNRRFELRLEGDGYQMVRARHGQITERSSGWSDLGVGAKLALTGERGWLPAMVVLPSLSMPSGAAAFTTAGYDPSVMLGVSRSLPAAYSVSGGFGVASVSDSGGRFVQATTALSLGRQLGKVWNTNLDACRLSALERDGKAEWMLGTGVSRLVGKSAQIDVQFGHTVGGSRSAWFVAAGLALRGPGFLFR